MNFLGTMLGKVVAAIVLLAIVLFAFKMFTGVFSAKQEARVAKGQAEASIESGAEAMNTIGNVMQDAAADEQLRKEGIDAIRNAPEGERGRVAVEQSCRLRVYVNSERCAALRAARAAGAGSSR